MRYSELLALGQTPEGRIPIESLSALREIVPDDVLEQFIFDHGANPDFQLQYGHLDLSLIMWERCALPASDLVKANVFSGFRDWTNRVAARLEDFGHESWDCIDVRPEVVAHWADNHTWLRLPVMLDAQLVGRSGRLHLVEGHTRLGVLRGLIRQKIVAPDTRHYVWVGRCKLR